MGEPVPTPKTSQIYGVKCCICRLMIEKPKELEWSENQENHPGVLGQCHEKCYNKLCEERPETPWQDPISGEMDFQGMGDDLGISPATEEDIWQEREEGDCC